MIDKFLSWLWVAAMAGFLIVGIWAIFHMASARADHLEPSVQPAPFQEIPADRQPCLSVSEAATTMFHQGYVIIKSTPTRIAMVHPRTGNLAFIEARGGRMCLIAVGNPEHQRS